MLCEFCAFCGRIAVFRVNGHPTVNWGAELLPLLAGQERFELPQTVLETVALPIELSTQKLVVGEGIEPHAQREVGYNHPQAQPALLTPTGVVRRQRLEL